MNEDNDEFNAINAMGAHLVELVEPVTRQDLDNLDNKVNELISSLTQKDKNTERIQKLVQHYFQKMDHINKNQFDVYNQILYDKNTIQPACPYPLKEVLVSLATVQEADSVHIKLPYEKHG